MKTFLEIINESYQLDLKKATSFKTGSIKDMGYSTEMGLEILRDLVGKYIDITEVYPRGGNKYTKDTKAVIKVERVIRPPSCNYTFVDRYDTYYEPTYDKIVYILDIKNMDEYEKVIKEREKQKEEKRLKHIEIDPYGEDEWE